MLCGQCTFNFSEIAKLFHGGCTVAPAVCESSGFYTSLSALGMTSLFYFSHSNGYVVLICISPYDSSVIFACVYCHTKKCFILFLILGCLSSCFEVLSFIYSEYKSCVLQNFFSHLPSFFWTPVLLSGLLTLLIGLIILGSFSVLLTSFCLLAIVLIHLGGLYHSPQKVWWFFFSL